MHVKKVNHMATVHQPHTSNRPKARMYFRRSMIVCGQCVKKTNHITTVHQPYTSNSPKSMMYFMHVEICGDCIYVCEFISHL